MDNYNSYTYATTPQSQNSIKDTIGNWLTGVGIISGTISAVLIAIIVYSISRMLHLEKQEDEIIENNILEIQKAKIESKRNPHFESIENLALSNHNADWRVAIIEADLLLEDVLSKRGYGGKGLGEMLTQMGQNAFQTYSYAWQAHKVRNNIAHGGMNYQLTKEETLRTIQMYRAVMQEFDVI
jgi:hypothetical protein